MYFTIEKIQNQLKEIRLSIHRQVCEIARFKVYECSWEQAATITGAERPDFDDRPWADFHTGETWGGYDRVAWFRAWVEIPPEWRQQKLALRFLPGPRDGGGSTAEAMLYVNGEMLQALDIWHTEAWLPPEFAGQERVLVAIKAWSGVLDPPDRRRFRAAQLIWIDEAAERFYYLAANLLDAVKTMAEDDLRRLKLLEALNRAFLAVDFLQPRSPAYYASLDEASGFLSEQVEAFSRLREIKPSITGIGHAHIDMAWLWRLRHTREKAARTFTTALHLMRQYPEYRFMHSSPQLYQYLKQDYPELYARVKEKIASGQWEVTGGMWVEADTNLTGGESLIRQFLLGRRFVRQEFGVEMNTLWLPDVFGYSWALPQIIRKCGMKYFITSKISWSQFNRFPADTFLWRGIDGTQVLTHFITTPEDNSTFYTYNGTLSPAEVQGAWQNYRQKDLNRDLLVLFGWGDGGGGPTKEMLESARVLKNLPGMPEVSLGKAEDFLARLEANLAGKDVPVWDGELYLEYHRGTYTSQAQNKRFNRKSEALYHDAEWLCALSDLLSGRADYPAGELRRGWELILLNQFHDILPGSSIREVYEDSARDYAEVERIGREAIARAQDTLAEKIAPGQDSLLVFNSLSWGRGGLLELPWDERLRGKTLLDGEGRPLPTQLSEAGRERTLLVQTPEIPALGYRRFALSQNKSALPAASAGSGAKWESQADISRLPADRAETLAGMPFRPDLNLAENQGTAGERAKLFAQPGKALPRPGNEMAITPTYLENDFYRLELNEKGQIVFLWDKRAGRQVLAPNHGGTCAVGNLFQAFEDKPMKFDAWDVDVYYQEKMRPVDDLVEAVVEECGPLRGVLRLRWRFASSEIVQRLTLYRDSPRIDFITEVDWRESQVLLKVAFPVHIRATRATYDIQFGSIERPTHWNTSWDMARFETPAHKWVDLSEGDYGVALLNDCKYGHDVKDNVLRLTLIKSAISPDPQADKRRHTFTYSLLPHLGDWRQSDVVQQAYDLNLPLFSRLSFAAGAAPGTPGAGLPGGELPGGILPLSFQFAQVESDHVILETVKRAEDGDAWVVRLYEYKQCRSSRASLRFGQEIRRAVECNLVEEEDRPAVFDGNELVFSIAPYEIKTFKVWF